MQRNSRIYAVKRNLVSSASGIFINILYSFVSRKIFVMTLGREIVGLSSLMGNLCAVLSLLDFGSGAALCFCLYSPIAKEDNRKISAYLSFYRRLCILSAFITPMVSLFLLPYIKSSVGESQSVATAYTAFLIFVIGNSLSGIFSAEKILLFADQKNYILQGFSYVFGGIGLCAESLMLIFFGNYIYYLLLHTAICLFEDLILTFYIRKQYPKIKFSGVKDKSVKKRLLKEMMYIQPSNIAGTLLRTFDNFLVVWLFGVAMNGTYSNYNMLVSYMSMLSVVITSSISATVGNIGASESPENCERIFRMTSICSFFPVAICTCLLFVMSGDIITLWLDKSNATGGNFSFVLALFFLVMGLKRSIAVFREGFGLYRKEKIKPFFELVFSLFLSVFFGKKMGLAGVYLGQAISSVICLLYEPYILYKYGFSKSVLPYYLLMLKYFSVSLISCVCAFMLCRNIFSFSLKAAVCIILPLLFSFAAFYGREEMKTAMNYFFCNKNKASLNKGS